MDLDRDRDRDLTVVYTYAHMHDEVVILVFVPCVSCMVVGGESCWSGVVGGKGRPWRELGLQA